MFLWNTFKDRLVVMGCTTTDCTTKHTATPVPICKRLICFDLCIVSILFPRSKIVFSTLSVPSILFLTSTDRSFISKYRYISFSISVAEYFERMRLYKRMWKRVIWKHLEPLYSSKKLEGYRKAERMLFHVLHGVAFLLVKLIMPISQAAEHLNAAIFFRFFS